MRIEITKDDGSVEVAELKDIDFPLAVHERDDPILFRVVAKDGTVFQFPARIVGPIKIVNGPFMLEED